MRCPHCATPLDLNQRTCRRCGKDSGDAPSYQPLQALQRDRAEAVEVQAQPLADLETNEDRLGDTRIPDLDAGDKAPPTPKSTAPAAPLPRPTHCPRCRQPLSDEGKFCDNCGHAVLLRGEVRGGGADAAAKRTHGDLESDALTFRPCLSCGIKNPPERALCRGCGMRLRAAAGQ